MNIRLLGLRALTAVIWVLSATATAADRFREWADWMVVRHGEALEQARGSEYR